MTVLEFEDYFKKKVDEKILSKDSGNTLYNTVLIKRCFDKNDSLFLVIYIVNVLDKERRFESYRVQIKRNYDSRFPSKLVAFINKLATPYIDESANTY